MAAHFAPRAAMVKDGAPQHCTQPRAVAVKGGAIAGPAQGLALDGYAHGGIPKRPGGEGLPLKMRKSQIASVNPRETAERLLSHHLTSFTPLS
jgi:hypothetical protein